MADAASANLQIRRPKSMFILRAMWKKAVIRRKKMQTALHFTFARRLQLLNVSLPMLLFCFLDNKMQHQNILDRAVATKHEHELHISPSLMLL